MAYIGTVPAQAPLTSAQLLDNIITTAKIIDSSITSSKIADGTVIAADVLDHTITTQKLSNTGVTAGVFGNATAIPSITVGLDGRITALSNTSFNAGATLENDLTTNVEYLVGMANATTGAWSTAYVSNTKLFFNPSTGTLSATNFNNLSDEELKTNIEIITNATATIKTIDGVEFNWKDSNKKSAGFIAQRIEEVLPHLVATNQEGMKSVNYSAMIAYLVETVKELDARLNALEAKG